jgi:fumarate reductase subunit D
MKTSTPIRQKKPTGLATRPGAPQLLSPLIFTIATMALLATVVAIYSPALDYQFILDDHHYVGDRRLQSSGHVWEYFTTFVWAQFTGGPASFYRPVFLLWMRLNFILCGMSAGGWHLLSIAKHLAATVCLGVLVWKLLRDRAAVVLAMTLFALHPSHTESVAWISVPDPLMAAAILVSLLLYFKYADEVPGIGKAIGKASRKIRKVNQAKPWQWLIASAAGCFAALLAKETGIVFPVVILVLAFVMPIGDNSGAQTLKSRLLESIRVSLPFLAVTAIYLLLRWRALGEVVVPTQHLPLRTVLLSWPATLWFYVKVLLWPVRSRAFGDSIPADTFSLSGVFFPALAVSCVVAILVWSLLWSWRKARRELSEPDAIGVHRALVVGTLLLVFPLLLTLNLNNLVPGDFLHGRYVYLPAAGLALLVATAWRLTNKSRLLVLLVAGLAAIAFTVFTVKQEGTWKDDLTVFTVAHEIAPRNQPVRLSLSRARVQFALRLDEEGRCDEAIPILEEAIRDYPEEWFPWAGLGECFFKLNDLPKAEQSLHRASDLSHQPRVTEQWQQLRARMGLSPAPE